MRTYREEDPPARGDGLVRGGTAEPEGLMEEDRESRILY